MTTIKKLLDQQIEIDRVISKNTPPSELPIEFIPEPEPEPETEPEPEPETETETETETELEKEFAAIKISRKGRK